MNREVAIHLVIFLACACTWAHTGSRWALLAAFVTYRVYQHARGET